jgi:very-short-patch-repair endonuclease
MAAVLSCGPDAALSHESAAGLWGIRTAAGDRIEVSVPRPRQPRRHGIVVHRRLTRGTSHLTHHCGVPVTTPVWTLIELATRLSTDDLEAAVNEADRLFLVRADVLREALGEVGRRPGAAILRKVLDRQTFTLTDSQLERRFLPLARRAGLSKPRAGVWINGFKVDFFWDELRLVVETDGLRYHRTPAQQARDRERDQAHAVAGLAQIRFTHAQVAFEPGHVVETLRAVAERLRP